MADDFIRSAFDEWTRGLEPLRARVVLFEKVRDIPYAYPASRNPVDVLRQGKGSCSGKHYLLAELYRLLDLPVRHMICTHRFNESPIVFPDHMQEMLRRNEVVDLHDFLQVEVDGNWIEIDATWPHALREFGFPVTEDWDGHTPMLLSVSPDEEAVVQEDAERHKEEMLSTLSPRQRKVRQQFLEALAAWVGELTADTERPAS